MGLDRPVCHNTTQATGQDIAVCSVSTQFIKYSSANANESMQNSFKRHRRQFVKVVDSWTQRSACGWFGVLARVSEARRRLVGLARRGHRTALHTKIIEQSVGDASREHRAAINHSITGAMKTQQGASEDGKGISGRR